LRLRAHVRCKKNANNGGDAYFSWGVSAKNHAAEHEDIRIPVKGVVEEVALFAFCPQFSGERPVEGVKKRADAQKSGGER